MAENLPAEDLLMKYLDNEMSEAERLAFEKRLVEEPGLQHQLESLQVALRVVQYHSINQQVAAVRRQLKDELSPQAEKLQTARVFKMKTPLRYAMAIAASIILVAGSIGGYMLYQLSPDKVFNESYVTYNLPTSRSGGNNMPLLERAYQQKNYNEVIQLSKQTSLTSKQQFLIGLSYLQINNLPSAITEFKVILDGTDKAYKQDAEYYLALTYLKHHDYNNALPLMKKIERDNNHLYHGQITRKAIREVEWLKWK